MADREARRLSFGSVAADYDCYRLFPPPQALDWLIPPGATAVLDLAAGTGAVTRAIMARNPRPSLARESREADRPREGRRRREVAFPPGTPMSPPEERRLTFSLPMTSEQLAGLLGTYSGVITLDPERRADFARQVRTFLDRQPWDRVDLPMICRCLRSTRLDRPEPG